jgi:hypothetical protein
MVKYPKVKVKLIGTDGNAYSILGKCVKEAKKAGLSPEEISQFREEAMSGDYDDLLNTCMNWFVIK